MEQIFLIVKMADAEIIISFSLVLFQGETIIIYDKYTGIDPTVCENFRN